MPSINSPSLLRTAVHSPVWNFITPSVPHKLSTHVTWARKAAKSRLLYRAAAAAGGSAGAPLPAAAQDGALPAERKQQELAQSASPQPSSRPYHGPLDLEAQEQRARLREALAAGSEARAYDRVRQLITEHPDNPHYLVAAAQLAGGCWAVPCRIPVCCPPLHEVWSSR